eukprot:1500732-Pyramimonas_sp.AAC.1
MISVTPSDHRTSVSSQSPSASGLRLGPSENPTTPPRRTPRAPAAPPLSARRPSPPSPSRRPQ